MSEAEPKAPRGPDPRRGIVSLFRTREAGIFLSLLLIIALILLAGPGPRASFLRPANLQNLSRQIHQPTQSLS